MSKNGVGGDQQLITEAVDTCDWKRMIEHVVRYLDFKASLATATPSRLGDAAVRPPGRSVPAQPR